MFTVGQSPWKGVSDEICSLFKPTNLNIVSSLVAVNLIHLEADESACTMPTPKSVCFP